MKLKSIVVASTVCLLGLGTSSAFASASSKSNSRADMQQLQASSNLMEASLNQNEDSILVKKPHLANKWWERITLTGTLAVDGIWDTKSGPTSETSYPNPSLFQNKSYTDIFLGNSQFDIDAKINRWTKAHFSVTGNDPQQINRRYRSDITDDAPVNLSEAYVTIGDFNEYPVWGTFGRKYMPFGVYDLHPIQPTLTQYLSQTQGTAAQVGAVLPMGFHTSAYAFRGDRRTAGGHKFINTYGVDLGVASHGNVGGMPLGYEFSVGWLSNMAQADWVSSAVRGSNRLTGKESLSGLSVDGMLASGPFGLHLNYVQTLSRYNTVGHASPAYARLDHQRPWAYGITGDYMFNVMDYHNKFSINYQQSGDAEGMGLPQYRYGADYTVGVLKDVDVTLLLSQDHNYSRRKSLDLGTGQAEYATRAAIRLSVDF